MNNNSTVSTVKSFSRNDVKAFDDFIRSPYFNKKSSVIRLWEILRDLFPDFPDEELRREKLYKKLFPGKEYNYGTIKNLIFDISKLAEKFLEMEFYNNDDYFNYYYQLGGLLRKGQMRLYKSRSAEIEKKLMNQDEFDGENYDKLFNLKWFKLEYIFSNITNDDSKEEVYAISKYLIYDFVVKLVKSFINIKGIELEFNFKNENAEIIRFFENIDLDGFINRVDGISNKDIKILSIYYKLYKSVSNPSDINLYFELKDSFIKNVNLFSIDERRVLYSGLRIALIFVSFKNDIAYDNEIFFIYKAMLEDNSILNYYGNIELIVFANYISYATRSNDAGFIKFFLEKYLDKIPSEHRENLKLFGEANISYLNKDYSSSLENLLKVNENILGIKRAVKNLEMIIHYERDDYDSFLYSVDSYKHYISRNKKITSDMKENIMRTIHYLSSMFKLKDNPDEYERSKLLEQVKNDRVPIKGWIIEKLSEYK